MVAGRADLRCFLTNHDMPAVAALPHLDLALGKDFRHFHIVQQGTVALLMMLFNGLIYAWSIFVVPLEGDFGWNRAQTSFVFALSMSVSILGQITGGRAVAKGRQDAALRLSAFMLVLGFGWASFIDSLPALYLSYGVIAGFAVGISYNAVMAIVLGYYPEKSGFASGILLMSFGLGSLLLGSATTSLIINFGWRFAFRVLAVSFGLLMFAGSYVVVPAPSPRDGGVAVEAGDGPGKMVKSIRYLSFFLWATLMSGTGLLILGHAATYAIDIGASLVLAGLSAGFISFFNGMSRLLFGQLYDRRGYATVMRSVCSLYLVAIAGLIVAYFLRSLPALFCAYAVLGLAYGGGPVTVSAYIKESYGGRTYGINLGITNLNIAVASFIGPLLAGVLHARMHSYLPAFVLMLFFVLVAFLLVPRRGIGGKP